MKRSGTFALVNFPDSPEYLYVEYIDGDPLVHTQKRDGVLEFVETLG